MILSLKDLETTLSSLRVLSQLKHLQILHSPPTSTHPPPQPWSESPAPSHVIQDALVSLSPFEAEDNASIHAEIQLRR